MTTTIKINPNELEQFVRSKMLEFANVDRVMGVRVIVDMADPKYPFKGYEVEVVLRDCD